MLLVAWEWVGSCCQHDIMSAATVDPSDAALTSRQCTTTLQIASTSPRPAPNSDSVARAFYRRQPASLYEPLSGLIQRHSICRSARLQGLHQQHALTDAQSRRAAVTPCPGLQSWYSPPSRSLTAAELQHRQLPALATRDHPSQTQRAGVRRQAPRQRAHATTTHSRVSRSADFYYRSPARPKPHTIGSHRTKSLPFLLTLDSHQLRPPSSRARAVITRRSLSLIHI